MKNSDIDWLMNPRILHHYGGNGSVRLNYIWEWSIHYGSLSAMFTPLHSSTNQELFEKYVCNQSSYYENRVLQLLSETEYRFPVSYV